MHKQFPVWILIGVLVVSVFSLVYFFKQNVGAGRAAYDDCLYDCAKIWGNANKNAAKKRVCERDCYVKHQLSKQPPSQPPPQQPGGGTIAPGGIGPSIGPAGTSAGRGGDTVALPCPEGAACDDGNPDTCPDVCDVSGACKGTSHAPIMCSTESICGVKHYDCSATPPGHSATCDCKATLGKVCGARSYMAGMKATRVIVMGVGEEVTTELVTKEVELKCTDTCGCDTEVTEEEVCKEYKDAVFEKCMIEASSEKAASWLEKCVKAVKGGELSRDKKTGEWTVGIDLGCDF